MTNVYYAVVNSTSCIQKEERRNKLRSILNPDLLIISFLKIKYTYVSILFFYLFILFYFIYHIFKLVKGGFICKMFEDRWGIFFPITLRHFDIWRRSQFSVQYWTFFGTSIFGYIFLFFEVHRKRIKNLKLM